MPAAAIGVGSLPFPPRLTPELELRLIPDASLSEEASSLPRLEAKRAVEGTIKVDEVEVKDCQEVESAPNDDS